MRRLALLAALFAVALTGADLPRPAPEYAIRMPDGSDWLLSQQKGKVVCLLFILTTCPHCQKLVATMTRLQPDLAPKGVVTIAAAIQDMANLFVPDFIRDFKPGFPVGAGDRNLAMAFMQHDPKYLFYSPSMSVIDRKGIIQAQYLGADKIFEGDQEKNLRAALIPLSK